jgi:hypothetical protein
MLSISFLVSINQLLDIILLHAGSGNANIGTCGVTYLFGLCTVHSDTITASVDVEGSTIVYSPFINLCSTIA